MAEPNGFYYMRARYYDPKVGRFISEDPIGFEGGTVNLYEYANNNPIMFKDPSGLCKWTGRMKMGGGGGYIYGGAIIYWDLKSECCNNKMAKGSYLTVCGGLSVGIYVSLGTTDVDFEGPDTPSHNDPTGMFSYSSIGGTIGNISWSRSFITTGSLVSTGMTNILGIDAGITGFIGTTMIIDNNKVSTQDCCSK